MVKSAKTVENEKNLFVTNNFHTTNEEHSTKNYHDTNNDNQLTNNLHATNKEHTTNNLHTTNKLHTTNNEHVTNNLHTTNNERVTNYLLIDSSIAMNQYKSEITQYLNHNYNKDFFSNIYFYNEELFQSPNNVFQAEGCGNLQNALRQLCHKIETLRTPRILCITIITGGYNSLGSKKINNYLTLKNQNTFFNFIVINDNPDINFLKQLGNVYYIQDSDHLLTTTKNITKTIPILPKYYRTKPDR
jgi:hypothetical protein